jgi:hypothetical protein
MKLSTRRSLFRSLSRTAGVFYLDQLLSGIDLDVQFVNVAREAGLRSKNIYGAENRNKYLLETTGCGAAFGGDNCEIEMLRSLICAPARNGARAALGRKRLWKTGRLH